MPAHHWAKLIRFVDGHEIGQLLTSYDAEKNLLRINRQFYDLLPPRQQSALWRATASIEMRSVPREGEA